MAPSGRPTHQLGPLNPGNVVSAALRLYRDRFKAYFKLSLLANLWVMAGAAGLAVVLITIVGLFALLGNDWLILVGVLLGLPLGILPLIYGTAKYALLSALVSRLAFRDLIGQPETSLQGQQLLAPKLWSFWALGILMALIYLGAYMGIGILALIGGASVGFVIAGILSPLTNSGLGTILGITVGSLLGISLLLLGLIWIASRLLIPETILAIETTDKPTESISRSWQLTQTAVIRIQVVLLAAVLISLPIWVVSNYLFQIPTLFLQEGSAAYIGLTILSVVSGLLGNILILPFWEALKGVLYYDLRSRREGLDLRLRNPADEGNN